MNTLEILWYAFNFLLVLILCRVAIKGSFGILLSFFFFFLSFFFLISFLSLIILVIHFPLSPVFGAELEQLS